MKSYILRRFLHSIIVLWGISTFVFFLTRLSGDPTGLMLPPDATIEQRAEYRERLGYDRPLAIQYWSFIRSAIQLDFGESIRHRQPALKLVLERVPATVELSGVALLIALIVSIPLGIIAAVKRGSWFDSLSLTIALGGQSFPVFWLGIMLILVFSEMLNIFPSGGRGDLKNLILPGLTLSFMSMAMIMRILRSSLLDVLGSDYIRTAKSKGLSYKKVLINHALQNAAIPVVTIIGLSIGMLLGGAIITETVFAWPGMGRLVVNAIFNRDYPIVQAFVFLNGTVILLINFIVDIVYALLDPRVKV